MPHPPPEDAVVTIDAHVLYLLVCMAQDQHDRLKDLLDECQGDEDLAEHVEHGLAAILIASLKLHNLEPAS